uniref:Uncharacterized protein n=1 Tax=Lactuca sativa TaxID=4236 RepID=A0A9R1XWK9_LACSA|nr:hypothetical protein LSAT_V11C200083910 [Lactuca sativa]
MRLNPMLPKFTFFHTHFIKSISLAFDFISSDENLYLMEYWPIDLHKLRRLDFHQLNWVPCEKTMEEYSLFHSFLKHGAVVKPESWSTPSSPYTRFFDTDTPGKR